MAEPARPPGTIPRRFTRLRPGSVPEGPGYYVLPTAGLCLSTFLILEGSEHGAGHVLMGRIDTAAPWFELAALDPARLEAIGSKWLLPASQLLFFEGPRESAERIAREQLHARLPPVTGPTVVSETSARSPPATADPHWDLHFLYRGVWPSAPPTAPAWRELRFVDVARLARSEIGRGHADILDLAGLSPRG